MALLALFLVDLVLDVPWILFLYLLVDPSFNLVFPAVLCIEENNLNYYLNLNDFGCVLYAHF